jgi:hypothetical protein
MHARLPRKWFHLGRRRETRRPLAESAVRERSVDRVADHDQKRSRARQQAVGTPKSDFPPIASTPPTLSASGQSSA